MRAFADSIVAAGATPRYLFLPSREDVGRSREGRSPSYEPLRARLADGRTLLIDPLDALGALPLTLDELFAPGGHYSARGNRTVADFVAAALDLESR